MQNKAELIAQLEHAWQLLCAKEEKSHELEKINGEIERLNRAMERGVELQAWYPTNNADITKAAIKKARHRKTVRRRTPCIVTLAVCGYIGVLMVIGGGLTFIGILGIFLLMVAAAALALLIIVQVNRNKWSAEQLEQLKQAEETDAQNKLMNLQKKEQLDAEFRKQKAPELAELHKQGKEIGNALNDIYREIMSVSVLSGKDKNWETVYGLLEILKSNRADTLQEALRIYDEQKHREKMLKEQREANWEHKQMQEKMLEQMQESEAHRQEEAELLRQEQAEHNREMENLAQKQINELEKKRLEDQDYRRSGYIRRG